MVIPFALTTKEGLQAGIIAREGARGKRNRFVLTLARMRRSIRHFGPTEHGWPRAPVLPTSRYATAFTAQKQRQCHSSLGGFEIFVVKYDAGGNVVLVRSAGGPSGNVGNAIAVDAAGNNYVTGCYAGIAIFGTFALRSAGAHDIFVAKYSNFGNGSVDPGDECDGGVGCTNCLCDADFEPTAPPSLDCQPICGNGSLDPGEECDDGNTVDGDGCSSDCLREEACCLTNDSCQLIDVVSCAAQGGIAQGPGSTCGGTEACCDSVTGECYMADRTCCLANGDSPQGPGTACSAPEACCFGDNTCQMLDSLCCVDRGGTLQGPGSTCGGTEACCDSSTGACYMADRTCCLANGDSPQGPGTACTAPQECCFSNNTCTNLDPLCCVDQGGTPQGAGSTCGTCGEGTCDCDEDFESCCQDCPCPECTHCFEDCFGGGRTCVYVCATDCGDGTCDPACENCDTCPQDCGCDDCTTCNAATGTCDPDCGNGVCQTEVCFENCRTCPSDCACDDCDNCTVGGSCVSACGDGTCDPACETCSSCPQDCHECGDGCCTASAGETCCSCTQDCGACCGNDVCDTLCGEDCSTCPSDCLTEEPCDVPAVSEWGLMALVLLLLIGLAIKFGQYRRVPTDA